MTHLAHSDALRAEYGGRLGLATLGALDERHHFPALRQIRGGRTVDVIGDTPAVPQIEAS